MKAPERVQPPLSDDRAWGTAHAYYREAPPVGAWIRWGARDSRNPGNRRWYRVTRTSKAGIVYGRAYYASGRIGAERKVGSVEPWRFEREEGAR